LLSIDFEFRVNGVTPKIPCQSAGKGSANMNGETPHDSIIISNINSLHLKNAENSDNFRSKENENIRKRSKQNAIAPLGNAP